jgi:hypothetical protein
MSRSARAIRRPYRVAAIRADPYRLAIDHFVAKRDLFAVSG